MRPLSQWLFVLATLTAGAVRAQDPSEARAWPRYYVYGKLGVARLEESFDVSVREFSLPCAGAHLPRLAFNLCVFSTAKGTKLTHALTSESAPDS